MRVWTPVIGLALLAATLGVACQANGGGVETSSDQAREQQAMVDEVPAVKALPTAADQEKAVQESVQAKDAAVDPRIDKLVKVAGPLQGVDVSAHAFPPVVPDTPQHEDAWWKNDCLRCHETGVGEAPKLIHRDLPQILLTAKCRTCHVQIKGAKPRVQAKPDLTYDANAFPPQIPASVSHPDVWMRDDCLKCHDSGLRGAPLVKHKGMPKLLLLSKCRTCHTQVRAVEFRQAPRR